ncbi:hypothetical protein ACQKWADRAFT_297364 [Trichoderma austrokoningii]
MSLIGPNLTFALPLAVAIYLVSHTGNSYTSAIQQSASRCRAIADNRFLLLASHDVFLPRMQAKKQWASNHLAARVSGRRRCRCGARCRQSFGDPHG